MPDTSFDSHAITTDDGVVAVYISAWVGDKFFEAACSAKTDPKDHFDEQTGIELAYGRALRSLGRKILGEGQRTVHATDAARKTQEAAAEKALKLKRKRSNQVRKQVKKALKNK